MTNSQPPMEKDVHFISTFEMYKKEESGIKSNTIRDIKHWPKIERATHIVIHKGYTSTFFRRKITDKTIWGNIAIVSWNSNEGQ